MEIREKIRKFIIGQLVEMRDGESEENLNDNTALIDEGIIDSLMILNLIEFIEESYGIILSGDAFNPENFETIQKIAELISNNAKQN